MMRATSSSSSSSNNAVLGLEQSSCSRGSFQNQEFKMSPLKLQLCSRVWNLTSFSTRLRLFLVVLMNWSRSLVVGNYLAVRGFVDVLSTGRRRRLRRFKERSRSWELLQLGIPVPIVWMRPLMIPHQDRLRRLPGIRTPSLQLELISPPEDESHLPTISLSEDPVSSSEDRPARTLWKSWNLVTTSKKSREISAARRTLTHNWIPGLMGRISTAGTVDLIMCKRNKMQRELLSLKHGSRDG
jgi:hypothetical protein